MLPVRFPPIPIFAVAGAAVGLSFCELHSPQHGAPLHLGMIREARVRSLRTPIRPVSWPYCLARDYPPSHNGRWEYYPDVSGFPEFTSIHPGSHPPGGHLLHPLRRPGRGRCGRRVRRLHVVRAGVRALHRAAVKAVRGVGGGRGGKEFQVLDGCGPAHGGYIPLLPFLK